MNTKEKILQYIDFKEISQGKFCRKIGVSNGFLASGKHIGSEKLKIIRDNYIDLNMNWLVYDEGEMIIDENMINEHGATYNSFTNNDLTISKRLTVALESNDLNDTFELLIKEYISLQKKQNNMQSNLTGLRVDFNKLKQRVKTLRNKN